MMHFIVLMIPGCRVDPIHPINQAPPASGKTLAGIMPGDARNLIVRSVKNGMCHIGPATDIADTNKEGTKQVEGENPGHGIADNG